MTDKKEYSETSVPVVIVGAGPVGLALAAELGRMRIQCLLIDKRDGVLDVPKMSQVSARAMEFCRRWGIAEKVKHWGFPEDFPFDNVFVNPEAYKVFKETGTWPDKTVFVMEVRASSTKGSINKGGHFQQQIVTIEAHVKDRARYPSGWEFFGFGTGQTAKPLGPKSNCQVCHSENGAVDSTFVQFYPTLQSVAKAKGTLKPEPRR